MEQDITQLLDLVRSGDPGALEQLIPLVYAELHSLARAQRRRSDSETVNTTALVHEAYEKLARSSTGFADRQHFFRVAARAMREVLVDEARKRQRLKRNEGARPLLLNEALVGATAADTPLVELDEALTRLATLNARQAQVVELRYFVGLTIPQTADILDLSHATVERDWTSARAWLHLALAS